MSGTAGMSMTAKSMNMDFSLRPLLYGSEALKVATDLTHELGKYPGKVGEALDLEGGGDVAPDAGEVMGLGPAFPFPKDAGRAFILVGLLQPERDGLGRERKRAGEALQGEPDELR